MPDSTWASCLKEITPRQIADGLNNCLEMHPEWPPGAVQFRAACLGRHVDAEGNDSSWQHKSDAYRHPSDPKHSGHDEWLEKQKEKLRIEDKSYLGKKKAIGNNELKNIKDIFK